MRWGFGGRPPDAARRMRDYLAVSLELAALPGGAHGATLWQRMIEEFWPAVVRASLHGLPPGVLLDVAAALGRPTTGWRRGSEASAAYHAGIRQLALAGWRKQPEVIDRTTLTSILQALWPLDPDVVIPVPPFPVDLSCMAQALRERARGGPAVTEPPGDREELDRWQKYTLAFMQLIAPRLTLARDSALCSEVAIATAESRPPRLASLELELLEELCPERILPVRYPRSRSLQQQGQLRHRRPVGPASPGVDGIELTDAMERACPWQLGLGRNLLLQRMAARELTAYRPPRRLGQRQSTSCLIAWLDPASAGAKGLRGQHPSYLAGKKLAGRLFLYVLGLAAGLGIDDLEVGLVALPSLQPPGFISPGQARHRGWRPDQLEGVNGLALLPQLPPLSAFFSRPAHQPTIAELCASTRLAAHGLSLVVAKSLMDAFGRTRTARRCIIALLVPESAWSLFEPTRLPADAAEGVRVDSDALLRSQLPVQLAALAVHDERAELRAVSRAASIDPQQLASGAAETPGTSRLHALAQTVMAECLVQQSGRGSP